MDLILISLLIIVTLISLTALLIYTIYIFKNDYNYDEQYEYMKEELKKAKTKMEKLSILYTGIFILAANKILEKIKEQTLNVL